MNSAARRFVSRILVLVGAHAEASAQSVSPQAMNRFMLGFHYGVPLKWSAVLAASLPGGGNERTAFVAAEPGIGGWRASVGYLRMRSDLGSGYVARGTLLRTSNKPLRAAPQSTFAGAEFQFMPLFVIGARVGGFVRIGRQGGQRGLLTADISLML
jgi:hypothetical protein